jgi:hypothetical protein
MTSDSAATMSHSGLATPVPGLLAESSDSANEMKGLITKSKVYIIIDLNVGGV